MSWTWYRSRYQGLEITLTWKEDITPPQIFDGVLCADTGIEIFSSSTGRPWSESTAPSSWVWLPLKISPGPSTLMQLQIKLIKASTSWEDCGVSALIFYRCMVKCTLTAHITGYYTDLDIRSWRWHCPHWPQAEISGADHFTKTDTVHGLVVLLSPLWLWITLVWCSCPREFASILCVHVKCNPCYPRTG